jgi:hypothetical protein
MTKIINLSYNTNKKKNPHKKYKKIVEHLNYQRIINFSILLRLLRLRVWLQGEADAYDNTFT